MRHIKKFQCFLIALFFILAMIPFKMIHAADPSQKYKVVGWKDISDRESVLSVKINGVEISEYDSSTYSPSSNINRVEGNPSDNLKVEIVLEDGVEVWSNLYLVSTNNLQFDDSDYPTEYLKESDDITSIDLPDEYHEEDKEIYLLFCTTPKSSEHGTRPDRIVESVTLNVNPPACGTTIAGPRTPVPDVSVPEGNGYKVSKKSNYWVKNSGTTENPNYVPIDEPFTAQGENEYIFQVRLIPVGDSQFDRETCATINNGVLLDWEVPGELGGVSESDYVFLTVAVTAKHVEGTPQKTNVISPTCTEPGSHDEIIQCSGCGKELSHTSSIVDDATGHDWGEWQVTKEPTINEEGIKECICKNDSSHVKTKTIACLDSCVVKFDNSGHGTTPDSQQIEVGGTAVEPENMEDKYYTFGGWYLDKECENPFDFETPITEDITLYAKWTPVSSEITFFKTGDESNIVMWFTLLGMSLTVIAFIGLRKNILSSTSK